MAFLPLLMALPASPFHMVLEVLEVEVWVAVPQLPLVIQLLQLLKCDMPMTTAKSGTRAVSSLALTSLVSASTKADPHPSSWLPQPSWLPQLSKDLLSWVPCQAGCLSPARSYFFKMQYAKMLKLNLA